jgi:hypothetical protein
MPPIIIIQCQYATNNNNMKNKKYHAVGTVPKSNKNS